MTTLADYLPAAESNRLLKKALKAKFPGIKFSCRMSRGTGYGSVHVSWQDGPTVEAVQEVTNRFEGQGFDGMTDSSYSKPTCIEVDGKRYRSGLNLILENREASQDALCAAIKELEAVGFVVDNNRIHGDLRLASRQVALGYETAQNLAARSRM